MITPNPHFVPPVTYHPSVSDIITVTWASPCAPFRQRVHTARSTMNAAAVGRSTLRYVAQTWQGGYRLPAPPLRSYRQS